MGVRNLFACLLVLLLAACSILKQPIETLEALRKCKFTIEKTEPKINITKPELTLSGFKQPKITIELDTKIRAENPTDKEFEINRMKLELYIDNKYFATLDTSGKIQIKPGSDNLFDAIFIVDAKNASEQIAKKIEGKKVSYFIKGTFFFNINNIEFPLETEIAKGEG